MPTNNKTRKTNQVIPTKTRPVQPATFEARCEAVAKDYEKQFKGNVLRWRDEGETLVILFVDGRKFYFPIPAGWRN